MVGRTVPCHVQYMASVGTFIVVLPHYSFGLRSLVLVKFGSTPFRLVKFLSIGSGALARVLFYVSLPHNNSSASYV